MIRKAGKSLRKSCCYVVFFTSLSLFNFFTSLSLFNFSPLFLCLNSTVLMFAIFPDHKLLHCSEMATNIERIGGSILLFLSLKQCMLCLKVNLIYGNASKL